jgi:hypothetical protein
VMFNACAGGFESGFGGGTQGKNIIGLGEG